MKRLAMAAAAALSVLAATSASAAPFVAQGPATQTLVEKAYYHHWHHGWWGPRVYFGPAIGVGYGYGYGYGYGGCGAVRHMCADRWGWGGPGFGRCMWRHGC